MVADCLLLLRWVLVGCLPTGENDMFKVVAESLPYARYMSYQVPPTASLGLAGCSPMLTRLHQTSPHMSSQACCAPSSRHHLPPALARRAAV